MEPADGVGYMGRNPMDDKNVYVITGDSGNGEVDTGPVWQEEWGRESVP